MKKLILIALACSSTILLHARDKDGETRTAKVKVTVSPSDLINIQAKYTELTVEAWDKNEVEIEATVRFDGKLTNKIQVFLDEFEKNVKDNIYRSAGQLKISSDLDIPNKIQIGSENVGINISFGDKELKINYKIKAPGKNKFVIANSYEDMRLIGSFNQIELTQYSGDLEAGNIKSAKMNLKYGSATVENLGIATMEIYEQELNARSIDELSINTKYSDLELRKVGKMDAVSYESDLQLGIINELNGDFKYGEIKVNELLEAADLTLYEVDIEADEIGTIRLQNSKYSEFEADKIGSIVFEQSYEDQTTIGTLGSFKSSNSKYGNHSIELLEGSFILNAYEDEVEIDRLATSVTEIAIDGKYIDASFGVGDVPFTLMSNVKYGKVEYDESQLEVKRYIKDNDRLEVEVHSKSKSPNKTKISVKGYEVDVRIE